MGHAKVLSKLEDENKIVELCEKIKKDHIPTIQLKDKHYKWSFLPNEYIESSNGEIINLVLTNIDLKLFFEQYDVYDLEYINGYKFKAFTRNI